MAAREAVEPRVQARDAAGIAVRGACKTFPAKHGVAAFEALRDVNLAIEPGEFVSLVGPSGCGKSTLLKLIGGLLERSSGAIDVAGAPVTGPRRDVGVMFQTSVLFPWRTVLENVLLPAEVFGHDRATATAKAREILQLVGLDGREGAYPRELSGGMQQRAALSRVLVTDPRIILMDEPFGALDEFTRERMNVELLRVWQQRGQTIVFVTHSIAEAVFLSDRIAVMGTGPGRVLAEVAVPLPRPRTIDMMKTPEFQATVFEVREYLGVHR